VELLRNAGIVVEAQFIVGLENETAETLEETYRMAQDWKPDLANWSMYTPWPFSDLFKELGDKVEIFDYEKYNFVTPIIKPQAMDRGELLDRVMKQLPPFLYEEGAFLLSLGRQRPAAPLSARLPGKPSSSGLRAQVLRSRQGRLLGAAIAQEGEIRFRHVAPARKRRGCRMAGHPQPGPASTMHDAAQAMACGGGKEQLEDALDNAPIDVIVAQERAKAHEHHLH